MAQIRIPAVFMRGGTSKGVFFREADLPADPARRDRALLAALGSPDPYGRQLNGMGGGLSSVSKAVAIGPPSRADADIDYSFAQVAVGEAAVDRAANCGNLSSAVGPFAIDAGMVAAGGGESAEVTIHNTNSAKLIRATVPLANGRARVEGDFAIPGVAGTGARIRLDFLDPGGTATGALLPTGRAADTLSVPGEGEFEASLVDSSVPCAFVAAARFGLTGAEDVSELEADGALMARVERVRRAAAVAMGLAESPEAAGAAVPRIALVAPPRAFRALDGAEIGPEAADLAARAWSMGRVHRALPLTVALCLAAARRVPGTVCAGPDARGNGGARIANPSGVLPLDAEVAAEAGGAPRVVRATAYRTARALMEGAVLVPEGT